MSSSRSIYEGVVSCDDIVDGSEVGVSADVDDIRVFALFKSAVISSSFGTPGDISAGFESEDGMNNYIF